jgi:hypothetical protein
MMAFVSFQHLSNWQAACILLPKKQSFRDLRETRNGEASIHLCPIGEAVNSSRSTIGLQVTISLKESACFRQPQERESELHSKRIP